MNVIIKEKLYCKLPEENIIGKKLKHILFSLKLYYFFLKHPKIQIYLQNSSEND